MALQYIGARYVPRFMGTYDNTQVYEALDVVDNGLGTSYIAKIPVPAGTPLTNITYWAIYGATSGAIINLQNQIDDMNDGTVPGSLQNQINTNRSDISDLKTWKNNLTRKNTIVLIGDSWLANSPTQIPTYLANHYGCTIKNYAVGGTGFDVTNGYKDQVNVMAADTTLDLDDVRFCIILCGLNDHSINPSPRVSYTPEEFATSFNQWKALFDSKFVGRDLPPVYWFHNYSLENWLTYPEDVVNPTDYWHQYIYYRTVRRLITDSIRAIPCFGFAQGSADCWQSANWRHLTSEGSIQYAENMCRVIDGAPPVIYPYQIIDGSFPNTYSYPTLKAKFIIEGNDLLLELNPTQSMLVEMDPTGDYATFDRSLPAAPVLNTYFGCGNRIDNYNYTNKTIKFHPEGTINTNYGNTQTRHVKRIYTTTQNG